MFENAGLCGPLVSVGTVGTSYSLGIGGTNLNTACSSRMEDQLAYLPCIASPSTCTTLCVPPPSPSSPSFARSVPACFISQTIRVDVGPRRGADREMGGSSLTGTLPSELGLLTALTKLYLFNNALSGVLPTELGLLTALTEMMVDENSLTGSLPTELGLATAMGFLYMFGNSFAGVLPTELGLLTALVELILDENSLTGSLPTELGLLTSLEMM